MSVGFIASLLFVVDEILFRFLGLWMLLLFIFLVIIVMCHSHRIHLALLLTWIFDCLIVCLQLPYLCSCFYGLRVFVGCCCICSAMDCVALVWVYTGVAYADLLCLC